MRVAFLGANSQVARSVSPFFLGAIPLSRNLKNYGSLAGLKLDAIVNCVCKSSPKDTTDDVIKKEREEILSYDTLCMEYLKNNPETVYIHISSGAVYSEKDSEYKNLKMEIEKRHRESDLNIIDLRLFSYFSRFIDHDNGFLMANILKAIKNDETLTVDDPDLKRDYIHPFDLYQAIMACVNKKGNRAVDVHSKEPLVLKDLINILSIKTKQGIITFKRVSNYYLPNYHHEFNPKITSLQTILNELNWAL